MDNFSAKFKELTNLDFDIISTVDHPYINPPARVLSSHSLLLDIAKNKQKSICILNWDVSQPNNRTYRYDNQLDFVFIGKQDKLLVFDDSTPYSLQLGNKIDVNNYKKLFDEALYKLSADKKISNKNSDTIKNNLNVLIKNVISPIIGSDGRLKQKYTEKYLLNFYSLIGHHELSNFIKNNYTYYYSSPIMTKWIPYCIKNAKNNKSLVNLLENNVISRRPFRIVTESLGYTDLNNIEYIRNNIEEICGLISNSKIIPSIDIFYWSMELANKLHFGNDYDFFERYSKYLNCKLTNQITDKTNKTDGLNLFQIAEDYSFINNDGNLFYRHQSSKSKQTRINSMSSVFILSPKKIEQVNPLSGETEKLHIGIL